MELGLILLSLAAGLALLVVGGDLLVRGASALAAAARISPLVIGLTVVAFGTSAPELAVSVASALKGQADLALGNVVGSNIFNVLFILGLSALLTPLVVSSQLIRFDVPLMIGLSGLVLGVSLDGRIGRWDGVFLSGGLLTYVAWSVWQSRRESARVQAEFAAEYAAPPKSSSLLGQVALIVLGLVLLVVGSQWLINACVEIARRLHVSELMIGLTIVAAGTSLPEVATSVIAALKGERDIAVGNVVGSNIFNILAVLGLTAVVAPQGIDIAPDALRADIPVMILVACACLPIFFTGLRISRAEGALFFAYYLAYNVFLVMRATEYQGLAAYCWWMTRIILPVTGVLLLATVVRRKTTRVVGNPK